MKKIAVLLVLSIIIGGVLVQAFAAKSKTDDKAAIAALEDRVAKAIGARDANAVMANYVKSDALVVFDVIPPREYRGWDAYLKDWQGVLGGCADSPKLDISDLAIETSGPLAYSHSIQHFTCTGAKGNKVDMTLRTTDVYRKFNGSWRIVHEHYSVPVDVASAKADLASQP